MSILFYLSCVFIVLGSILSFLRMLLGPKIPDRVVALDVLTNLLIAAIVLFSVYTKQDIYLDIVVIIVLIMFLSSVMYARYLETMASEL